MEKTYGFNRLGKKTKIIVIITILLGVAGILADYQDPEMMGRDCAVVLIGCGGGWLFGCFNQIVANEKGRNSNFAFLIGWFLGIFGGMFYWIYSWFFKEVENGES